MLRNLGRINEAKQALSLAQQYGAAWPAVDDPALGHVRALRDDAEAHLQRGLARQRQDDVAGAIVEYEAAVATNPQLAAAHVNLIGLYCRQQDWARVDAHYWAVLQVATTPAEAHFNFGLCLAAQGKTAEATDAFRKALEVSPEYAGAWSSLGQIAELGGRIEEAEADYRKAAERAPSDPMIRFNIARMLIARKQDTEAIAEIEPVLTRDHPEQARFLFGLATAHVLSGDVAGGRRYAVEARDLAKARGQSDLAAAIDRELERLPQ